ncbi:FtsX-like permease family protein [Ornithinimicrobium cavernae]|uniref:FtsX-like permease family protein n=1 Tax=Ornithinimicrobium cavernae TaxID=2666047 RepID=UPI000D68D8BE|nr:FtsX-like permease family protein [Ornithinimicrobium cavernae]
MGVLALVVKRARAGLGLLLTILVLAAGTTAIIAGTLGYSEAAATTAARQALSAPDPTEAGIRVQTRLAEDPGAQAAAAERIIREEFAPTEVHVQRTVVSEPRAVADHEGRLIVMAGPALSPQDPDFTDRIEVVEGTWPEPGDSAPVQGALHEGAAAQWEVGVGDRLDVSGATVEITAVWRPVDAREAFWFGDPLIEAGSSDSETGPLVVPEAATTSFGDTPFVRFTVQPDAERVLPADMPRLAAVAGALDSSLRTPEVEVRGVTVEGDLAPTASAASRNLATARALNLVPVTLLLLVSLIAIVQIARLQAEARAGEVELMVARGASRGQLLTWSVIESVAVAVLAAALGTLAALGVMQLVPAGELQTGIVVRTGIAAGVAVLAALVVVAVLQVRSLSARTATDRSGRTRTVAALGTMVLTLGAAAISWWQLSRYGSPLVTNPDGTLRTDLVAGAAPALLLAAAALLATTVLGPVGRLVEASSRSSRGLLTHLVSAQVSRRIVVYAVPVVLTVLAVGATTASGLYAGTSAQLREGISALGRGADLRATVAPAPVSQTMLPAVPTLAGTDGIDASAPVWLSDGRVGSTIVSSTVLPIDQLGHAVSVPDGVLDVPEVTAALRGPAQPEATIALPAGATGLELTVELTVAPPEDLQAAVDHTYEFTRQQTLEGGGGDPSDPDFVEFADQLAEDQAALELREFTQAKELTAVLWFWDEPSSTLLRVDTPAMPFEFDVGLSEPPGVPQVSASPSTTRVTVPVPVAAAPGRSLVGIDLGLPQTGRFYDYEAAVTGLTTSGDSDSGTNLMADDALGAWVTPIPGEWPVEQDTPSPTTGTLAGGGQDGLVLTGTTGREDTTTFRNEAVGVVQLRAPGLETGSAPAPGATTAAPEQPTGGTTADTDGEEPDDAVAAPAGPGVPVAITHSLAATGNFEVGMPITVQALGRNIPAEVAAIVTAVPGSTAPHSVLIDTAALSGHLSRTGETLGAPTQVWASSSDPDAALERVRELPGIASASGPGDVSVTDAASAVRLVFWVAAAGAVLLAVTGIGAVAANLLRVRRAEVSVLRALGMTPGGQARARTAELFSVVLASIGLGLLAGWLVGWLVVPELARSTTLAGQAELPAPLALEVPLWAALLGALLATLVLLLAVLYATVRGQALDTEYREEIR